MNPPLPKPFRGPMISLAVMIASLSVTGCHVSPAQHLQHLCHPVCLTCDDYQAKCPPVLCIPNLGQHCDSYRRKCYPDLCFSQHCYQCDDYCAKCPPDACQCARSCTCAR